MFMTFTVAFFQSYRLLLEKVTLEHMGVDVVNSHIFAVTGKQ